MEAVAIEAGNLKTSKGLGRRFSWTEFLAGEQITAEPIVDACMYCVDGDAA